jgi:hypothetical protein
VTIIADAGPISVKGESRASARFPSVNGTQSEARTNQEISWFAQSFLGVSWLEL